MGFTQDIATSSNIPNTAVKRDQSSQFSVNTIFGNISGNASSSDDGIIAVVGNNGLSLSLENKIISGDIDSNVLSGKVYIYKNSTLVGDNKNINFIESGNVSLSIADDSLNDRINITIGSTGVVSGTSGVFTGNVSLENNNIVNLLDPTNPQDAATKAYVDAGLIAGSYTAGNGLTLTGSVFSANTNTLLGTTINSNNIVLSGLALALHQLSSTDGIIAKTGVSTVSARTITGTSNRVAVTNGGGAAGNPTIDIDTSYVGQTSITTVGTISTGTWNATDVSVLSGGTGASTITGSSGAKRNLEYGTKYAATITGNGSATSFTVTHNFETNFGSSSGNWNPYDINVNVFDNSNQKCFPDVVILGGDSISIVFGIAPLNGVTYRVVVTS